MNPTAPSTRRDPRATLPKDSSSVEFVWLEPDRQTFRGEVVTISATGLAFAITDAPTIEIGAMLAPVTLHIDDNIVQGDLSVRFSRPVDGDRIEFGCLFYPETHDDAVRWLTSLKRYSSAVSSAQPQLMMRCVNCHSIVWVSDINQPSYPCRSCNQEHGFDRPIRGKELEDLHRQARGMGLELGIDLPSATSMLLGILTLGDVKDVLDDAPPAEAPSEPSDTRRKSTFDKAFLPAIEAGTLTEAQAIQRGNREAFAGRLITRHRVSSDDAYAVADNRTSLLALLRKREASKPIKATYPRRAGPSRIVAVAALAGITLVVSVVGIRWFDREVNSSVHEPESRRAASAVRHAPSASSGATDSLAVPDLEALPVDSYARVRTDENGEIVSVEATDPGNVLLAFCKHPASPLQLEAVDVIPTVPPSDVARIGLVRDLSDADAFSVVVIRRDLRSRRWYLRNTSDPEARVSMFPAPDELVQAAVRTR